MKLTKKLYFVAEDRDNEELIGLLIPIDGVVYLLSDNEHVSDNAHINKLGFQSAYKVGNFEYKDEEDLIEQISYIAPVYGTPKVLKGTEGLRAIISYRKNHLEVASYSASFNGYDFQFGCGAVEATPSEVAAVVKVLSKLTPNEWLDFAEIARKIHDEDSYAFARLKTSEKEIKSLLKMPSYLASATAKKVATKKK